MWDVGNSLPKVHTADPSETTQQLAMPASHTHWTPALPGLEGPKTLTWGSPQRALRERPEVPTAYWVCSWAGSSRSPHKQ